MDISLFSKCLNVALLENDFVNIPGLGCFLTELMPAYFSNKGATINPPYRKLFFREVERDDDGVFLTYLKSQLEKGTDPAEELKHFIAEFKQELNRKKNIKLGELGTMRATSQNDFFFVANEELDIYPAGFGLEPISIKAHIDFTEAQEEGETTTEIDVQNEPVEPTEVPLSESQDEPVVETEVQDITATPDEPQNEMKEALVPEQATEIVEKAVPAEVSSKAPQKEVTTPPRKKCKCGVTILIILLVIVAFFVVVFALKESTFSQTILNWCENILYHLLYTKEELYLLGR